MKLLALVLFLGAVSPAQAGWWDDFVDWVDPPSAWEESEDGVFTLPGYPPDSFWSIYNGGQNYDGHGNYGDQHENYNGNPGNGQECCSSDD